MAREYYHTHNVATLLVKRWQSSITSSKIMWNVFRFPVKSSIGFTCIQEKAQKYKHTAVLKVDVPPFF